MTAKNEPRYPAAPNGILSAVGPAAPDPRPDVQCFAKHHLRIRAAFRNIALQAGLRYFFIILLSVAALRAQNGNNYIIQNTGGTYDSDVRQLESDSVQAFLTLHGLPSTDSALLYEYGRRDLRDELRGWILTSLQSIIAKPAASRSVHEQNVYNWFEALVYQNEVAEYKYATAEHLKFVSNRCQYQLDSNVANAYNLTYNPAPFCISNDLGSDFLVQPTPGPNYYLAVGLENSYNAKITIDPQGAVILGETATYNEINLEYAILPAAAAGSATGALYATSVIAPYAFRAIAAGAESIPAITDALDIAILSSAEAGPVVGIIGVAAAIGIQAGMENQLFSDDQNALAAQQTYYNSLVQNCNSIDLNLFLTDATGVGRYKLLSTLLATTLPDVPSTTPLPARTEGVDPVWGQNLPNGPTSDTMQYVDWNGVNWTASLWGNYVLQFQTNNPSVTSFTTTLNVASYGTACESATLPGCFPNSLFSASRVGGQRWLFTPQTPVQGSASCPPSPYSGLSTYVDSFDGLYACTSFVGDEIQLVSYAPPAAPSFTNWSVITPPVFATNGTATFVDGTAQSIVLTAQLPEPTFFGETGGYSLSGPLPRGFSFLRSPSGLTLQYRGDPDPNLPGTYHLTLSAQFGSNGGPGGPSVTGTMPFTITVKPGDAIEVRSNTLNAYVGDQVSYTIETAGHSNPNIQLTGISLPPGLSFTRTPNGAVIQGSPRAPGSTSGTIETDYGATNPLSVSVTYRQSPAFTNPSFWQFTDNVQSQFRVLLAPPSASGPGPSPTIFVSSQPFPGGFVASPAQLGAAQRPLTSAPWLQVQTGNDGTARLSGTPPAGTGTFNIYLASVVPNSVPAFQTLTLSSSAPPAVSGPDLLTTTSVPVSCPAGTPPGTICGIITLPLPIVNIPIGSLTFVSQLAVTTQGNNLLVANSTVSGLFNVYSYLTAAGTSCPIPGVNGAVAAMMSNLRGPSSQAASFHAADTVAASNLIPFHTFHVEIDAPPSITSQPTTYFSSGAFNSFSVSTTGFPEANPVAGSKSSATAMRVKLSGILPQGVTFNDLTPAGEPTGTGILSGTPTQTGTFPVTIVAKNGVGTPATQDFTLVVDAPGDVNGDGVVNCADITAVKAAFGTYQGQAAYNPRADVNHDYTVNILDLAFVTAHLPKGTRCQ